MTLKLVNASLLFSLATLPFCTIASTKSNYQDQPKLHDIAAGVSASRIESDIQSLVDFGTRHTLSETKSDTRGIGAARRWIKAEFEKISAECGGFIIIFLPLECRTRLYSP